MVKALAAAYGAKRVSDPSAADTDMGPLAMERRRDKVESLIAKGMAEGAIQATSGGRPAHRDRG